MGKMTKMSVVQCEKQTNPFILQLLISTRGLFPDWISLNGPIISTVNHLWPTNVAFFCLNLKDVTRVDLQTHYIP